MHTCNGIELQLHGSVIKGITWMPGLISGNTTAARVSSLWGLIKVEYGHFGLAHQLNILKPEMSSCTKDTTVYLKGCKAVESNALAFALEAVLAKLGGTSAQGEQRLAAYKALATCYRI